MISRCLLLRSTFTPAGNANNTAGITSLNPRTPIESLLPVISYSFHPRRTGVILNPAINKNLAIKNQVNSVLIIVLDLIIHIFLMWDKGFVSRIPHLMATLNNAAHLHNLCPVLQLPPADVYRCRGNLHWKHLQKVF